MTAGTPLTSTKNEPNYMIQLDALRALAVFGVIIQHNIPDFFLNSFFLAGYQGVRFFFVLSGFLITSILLRCKQLIEKNDQTPGFTIRQFYIRRFIRIFPIYYLTLAITYILHLEGTKETFWWNLTHTSNFYFALAGEWPASVSHFWTLSVEDQFYLIWPFVIFFTPTKHLLKVICLTISIAPIYRVLCIFLGLNGVREYVITFACLDSLVMGAFLAFITAQPENVKFSSKLILDKSFWIGLPLFFVCRVLEAAHQGGTFLLIFGDTVSAIFFMWVIYRASKGFGGILGKVLEMKPLVYLGKISYGIYLYHLFLPYLFGRYLPKLGLNYPDSILWQFILNSVTVVILASLSWYVIEKPINDLKQYFPYKQKIKPQSVS